MKDGSGSTKPGYRKIKKCGEIASSNRISYFWVDTCCIDKSSSAELSESINSMFDWYKRSDVCYAYLSDVGTDAFDVLKRPRWFSRGWTLQELIAPRHMVFFNAEWNELGSKSTLCTEISQLTRIDAALLKNVNFLHGYSVAQKMSWAADRETTRIEDISYSLLGLFNVNMPLLYGEAERAFRRLQKEILLSSHDQSIFAWQSNDSSAMFCGLLARSPSDFRHAGNISTLDFLSRREPVTVTSRGIRVPFYLAPSEKNPGLYEAHLECYMGKTPTHRPIIYILRTSGYDGPGGFEAADMTSQYTRFESSKMRTIDPISPLEAGARGRHAYIWVQDFKPDHDISPSAQKYVFFRVHKLTDLHCNFAPKTEYDFRLEAFVAERMQTGVKAEKEWFRVYLSEGSNRSGRENSQDADYLVFLGLAGYEHPWCALMARPDSLQSSNTSWKTTVRERFDSAKIWRGVDYKPASTDGRLAELDLGNRRRLKLKMLSDNGGVEIPIVISIE